MSFRCRRAATPAHHRRRFFLTGELSTRDDSIDTARDEEERHHGVAAGGSDETGQLVNRAAHGNDTSLPEVLVTGDAVHEDVQRENTIPWVDCRQDQGSQDRCEGKENHELSQEAEYNHDDAHKDAPESPKQRAHFDLCPSLKPSQQQDQRNDQCNRRFYQSTPPLTRQAQRAARFLRAAIIPLRGKCPADDLASQTGWAFVGEFGRAQDEWTRGRRG
jgi:hypothetical protein